MSFFCCRKKSPRLVPDDTVHMVTDCAPFGTLGSLTLDITIALFLITPFLFYFLYFTLQII